MILIMYLIASYIVVAGFLFMRHGLTQSLTNKVVFLISPISLLFLLGVALCVNISDHIVLPQKEENSDEENISALMNEFEEIMKKREKSA